MVWVVPYVHSLKPLMIYVKLIGGNTLYVLLLFLMATYIQFVMGKHFYLSAYKSIKHKSANMDVLIVISTTAAWLYGVVLSLIGYSIEEQENEMKYKMMIHAHVHNWETSSILIVIIILGKYIESYSKMKTVG